MKKILAIIIVVLMLFSFAGCKSSDYKKAVGLYDSGNFAEAAVIFAELGDYEDSAKYLKDAKWYALHDYIEKNGSPHSGGAYYSLTKIDTSKTTVGGIYTVPAGPETFIFVATNVNDLGFSEFVDNCSLTITKGSSVVQYALSSEMTMGTAESEESANGAVDINLIASNTKLDRNSNFSSYSKDIYGNVKRSSTPDEFDLTDTQGLLDDLLSLGESILAETGLGITLADLGFTSYK